MANGVYVFRVEDFTLDQQASTINDSLILSIITKIDDSPVKASFSVPIAVQIYSGSTVELGRWAETPPITVADESIITVVYQVLNMTGGYPAPFATINNELNSKIMPPIQEIANLAQ